MTADEFVAWCQRHHIKTDQAWLVLGCSRSSAFRYASGRSEIPAAIAYQCELMDLLPASKSVTVTQKRLAKVSP